MSKKKEIFDEVHDSLEKTAEKMKQRYLKNKTVAKGFKVGDRVQYRNLSKAKNHIKKKKDGSKWFPRKGFLVVKEIDEKSGMLRLRKRDGMKIVKSVSEKAAILYTDDK